MAAPSPPLTGPAVLGGRFGGMTASDVSMPALMVGILALMILPLPPIIIDLLLAVNITLSVLILLTSLQVRRPLEFSAFPSLLLVATLFRLGLNVSTTRLILVNGAAEGSDAAGNIVKTFGDFVVGGNYVVGIVIFLILTLINFIVITKGAGRVAEVSARFTLDALPGKQMSIDSDLASGLISQEEARTRRVEVAQETDFYGAMDGSSKFVRGDAIAGLVITTINIVGGLVIGTAQEGLGFADAAGIYTILTIGDGLVSQIPTLLISTASGVVITRAAEESDLAKQLKSQILNNKKVLLAAAGILLALSFVPGMPIIPFALLILTLLLVSRRTPAEGDTREPSAAAASGAGRRRRAKSGEGPKPAMSEEEELATLIPVQAVQLEVGYALVALVNKGQDGDVVRRIVGVRKNIAQDLGIILPPVHVRDNLDLAPGEYRVFIHGVETARGSVMVDRLLAMDPGDVSSPIRGVATVEPAFGLPALWIRRSQQTEAELAGYTVVEPATVIITHVSSTLEANADKLLGREELGTLLEIVAKRNAKVVEELLPGVLSYAELLAVLRGLLREQVPIRDLRTILEGLADAARYGKSIPFLIDQARVHLGGAIVQRLSSLDGKLHAAIFDAPSEDQLRQFVLRNDAEVALAPDLPTAQALLTQLQRAHQRMQERGHATVIIAPADLRYPLWRFASRLLPQVSVLGQSELPPRVDVVTTMTLSIVQRRPAGRIPVPPRGAART